MHAQTGVACLSTKGRKEIRPVSTLTDDVRGRNGRLRRRALAGRLTQAQRWVLAEFLVRLAEVEAALSRVETRMGEEVAPYAPR